jgi:AraC-like DNA-binding protein/mannose-6-phosphate isomerase-like protein (cupin superfamily)
MLSLYFADNSMLHFSTQRNAMTAIKWIDKSIHTPNRTVLTEEELLIPGLQMFGLHQEKRAYQALPEHFHPECLEITYLERGIVNCNTEKESFQLYPGDLLIIQPDIIHSSNKTQLSMNSMYWFQLNVSDPNQFFFLQQEKALATINSIKNLGNCCLSLNQAFYSRIFSEIFKSFISSSKEQKETGAMELLYFLKQILANAEEHGEAIKQSSNILKTLYYIKKHLKEDIKMDELAELANLSTSRFKQKFTLEIGQAPRTYINSEKIIASIESLLEGKSVTETALDFNFSSSNYYCEVFKRFQGKAPSQFLKTHKRKIKTEISYTDGFNEMSPETREES